MQPFTEGGERGSVADFIFGGNENQIPLLDASHFSPFAEAPKRPFLRMPKQAARTDELQVGAPQVASLGPGNDRNLPQKLNPRIKPNLRKGAEGLSDEPGDAATLPELIRFLIDRTGYIKALEAEASPESFSRIENLKELANAAHDAEAPRRNSGRIPRPRGTRLRHRPVRSRCPRHADDAARGQGPRVSAGLSCRP